MKAITMATLVALTAALPELAAQPVMTQSGRALDANPSMQSRYNAPSQPGFAAGGGQYMIGGELRLGRSFQGVVPYSSTGQFQGNLGSGGLYNFERDSFSIHLLQRGTGDVYGGQPLLFRDSSRVVFDAGRLPEVSGQGANFYARLKAQPAAPVDMATGLPAPDSGPLQTSIVLHPLPLDQQLLHRRRMLDEQERQLREGFEDPADPSGQAVTRIEPMRPVIAETPVQPTIPDRPGEVRPPEQLRPGADLYLDLLERARQAEPVPGDPTIVDREPTFEPAEQSAPPAQEPDEAVDESDSSFLPAVVNLQVNYSSLSSPTPTRANSLIQQAEQLLAAGRFYDAVATLAAAKSADPANPLVWLRSSHALFGAGEFASSAHELTRAIRLFPSVVSVQTPLLVASTDVIEGLIAARLEELARLANSSGRTDLLMLLCYAQSLTGRRQDAERSAQRLPESKGFSPEAAALRRFVLRAGTPTSQADGND